ncbi:hypothetical protein DP939_33040 [Spongiactinospora rosea]|uniref:Uncharacterized protein n=1 Tax=Spongiactinospora rosea TaxID=2248750 RepID=A0A366LR22_9ACTN|nr:hypothetical protein [Spongiactinospora rosea]RBQ15839.1 hypothetical protein DP939_33040 [Spongiactinospora rosea]
MPASEGRQAVGGASNDRVRSVRRDERGRHGALGAVGVPQDEPVADQMLHGVMGVHPGRADPPAVMGVIA